MESWIRRIEEIRVEAEARGVDLSDIHIWEPVGWVIAAADRLGIEPGLALAFDLDWDFVRDRT